MVSVSQVKGVITGVTKVAEHVVSSVGAQTVGNVFAQGTKTASQLAETAPVVFNNKFFKTVAQDVSVASRSQISLEGISDDVVEFCALDKQEGLVIRKIKNFFRKISQGSAKPTLLGIDRSTVDRLNKLPDEEFLLESISFIFNNYTRHGQKIPKELMPVVIRFPLNAIDMAYDPMQNIFMLNEGLKINNRAALFGSIKHEFTHMWQALDIFRTKSLGERFSKVVSQKIAKNACEQIQMTSRLSQEEFASIAAHPNFAIMQQYRQYLASSPETANQYINAIFENTANTLLGVNEQKRMFIIKALGPIAENSERGKRAKLYFRYFKNGTSADVMSNVEKFKKYTNEIAEQQAYAQSYIGTAEYLFPEINEMIK